MHVDATVGGREASGRWVGAWAGRMLVAACLAASWGAATLAPLLLPNVALAQDEGGEEEPQEEGQSYLTFLYVSLGLKYVIVFLTLSFSLVALLVMCFLQFRKSVIMPPTLSASFESLLEAKQYPEAFELVKNDESYLGKVLATGISQALVTTLIGLWLAIPAIACYAVLKNWLQKFNSDVDDESMRLMSRFQNIGKK